MVYQIPAVKRCLRRDSDFCPVGAREMYNEVCHIVATEFARRSLFVRIGHDTIRVERS